VLERLASDTDTDKESESRVMLAVDELGIGEFVRWAITGTMSS
jgi:hypothetical protein